LFRGFQEEKTMETTQFYRAILIAMLLSFSACAAAKQPAADSSPVNLTGTWRGEIRVIPCPNDVISSEPGRCDAVNQITFNLRQKQSGLAGTYHCSIGTMVCRDENTTGYGKVIGSDVSGRDVTVRVLLPGDLSTCLYNGLVSSTNEMSGSYRCYQGGGLSEVGQWQVSRSSIAESQSSASRPE
jgi:hypothetical protein